ILQPVCRARGDLCDYGFCQNDESAITSTVLMNKKLLSGAALVLVASAAVLFLVAAPNSTPSTPRDQFVRQRGGRFMIGQKPFRFVGANVAVMYRDEDR